MLVDEVVHMISNPIVGRTIAHGTILVLTAAVEGFYGGPTVAVSTLAFGIFSQILSNDMIRNHIKKEAKHLYWQITRNSGGLLNEIAQTVTSVAKSAWNACLSLSY